MKPTQHVWWEDTIAEIKSTLRLHTWILTFNTPMIIAVVGRLFLGGR